MIVSHGSPEGSGSHLIMWGAFSWPVFSTTQDVRV